MSAGAVYVKDGISYDRITAVLDWVADAGLTAWKQKVGAEEAEKIGNAAKARGTAVDKLITATLEGKEVQEPLEFEQRKAWLAWNEWANRNVGFKPAGTQKTFYNDLIQVAGTPDCWTSTEVIDWKVGSRMNWKYLWQVNEYCKLLQLERWRIVRLDPALGIFEEVSGEFSGAWHDGFYALLKAYRDAKGAQAWLSNYQRKL